MVLSFVVMAAPQRETLLQQLETNRKEMKTVIDELDIHEESEEQNYDMYVAPVTAGLLLSVTIRSSYTLGWHLKLGSCLLQKERYNCYHANTTPHLQEPFTNDSRT